jgi:hypothetical protein
VSESVKAKKKKKEGVQGGTRRTGGGSEGHARPHSKHQCVRPYTYLPFPAALYHGQECIEVHPESKIVVLSGQIGGKERVGGLVVQRVGGLWF